MYTQTWHRFTRGKTRRHHQDALWVSKVQDSSLWWFPTLYIVVLSTRTSDPLTYWYWGVWGLRGHLPEPLDQYTTFKTLEEGERDRTTHIAYEDLHPILQPHLSPMTKSVFHKHRDVHVRYWITCVSFMLFILTCLCSLPALGHVYRTHIVLKKK
jgi:hypothetical protein